MARFLVVLSFVAVAFDVFALVDVFLTDQRRVRALNKLLWVVLIVFLPVIGAVLWFLFGKARPNREGQARTLAPDDDPAFLRNLRRDEAQDERIRKLEQELAELDDDQPKE